MNRILIIILTVLVFNIAYGKEKYGYIDRTGKEVIEPKYEFAEYFSDGMAVIGKKVKEDGVERFKYGYIDKSGKEITGYIYSYAGNFSDSVACVMAGNGKYGYIDKTGKTVLPFIYNVAENFKNGVAWVKRNEKSGNALIDKSGKVIFELDKNTILCSEIREDRILVLKKNKYGYLDVSGKVVIPFKYDYATDFINGKAVVAMNNPEHKKYENYDANDYEEGEPYVSEYTKVIYIDKNGNKLKQEVPYVKSMLTEDYDKESPYPLLEPVHSEKKMMYGYFDENGKNITGYIYTTANDFSEGLASVEKNGKYGFIDRTGKEVIPRIYDFCYEFSEGISEVKRNGKWGYIDKTGKVVIPFRYDKAYGFFKELAIVKIGSKKYFISKRGEIVIDMSKYKKDYFCFIDGMCGVSIEE